MWLCRPAALIALAAAWPGWQGGIFGFKLTFSSGLANLVLVTEVVAIITLAITGALPLRQRRAAAGRPGPGPGRPAAA